MLPHLFIQADGVPGSYPPGAEDQHGEKWTLKTTGLIRIESIKHAMELPISRPRSSFASPGYAASIVEHHPLIIRRYTDASSTGLIKAFLSRQVMKYFQVLCGVMAMKKITLPPSTSNQLQPQWILRVTNALITEFSYESSESGGFLEDISIDYASIAWGYRQELDSGALAKKPNVAGIVNNTEVVEAFDGDLEDSKFTPSKLDDYFVDDEYT